jgi:hypothetical protein
VVFPPLFANISDPRDPLKITYPLASLAFAGVTMFLYQLKARRQIGLLLRNGPSAIKFQALFGVESFPHGDTLEATFSSLEIEQIQTVVTGMTETLIRKKVLYSYRLLGIYFIVAIDGTGTISYSRRHCPHCLTRTRNGKTLYYHPVLEAKLITSNGFAFSLMTEFIENPGDKATKQDCELKAFYRLAKRLKTRCPRLPILLSMDGLFAGGPTFDLCRRYGWKFMIVLKDDDLSSVNEEFDALSKLQLENRLVWRTGKQAQIKQAFRWVDDIAYVDSEKNTRCPRSSVWRPNPTRRDRRIRQSLSGSPIAMSRQEMSRPYRTTEGGCDGKLKTKDSTYKKRGDMNWSMLTPIILTRPRSFTSSCRSLICSPNFSTRAICLKGISRRGLARQKTWPSDCWKLGEMPA